MSPLDSYNIGVLGVGLGSKEHYEVSRGKLQVKSHASFFARFCYFFQQRGIETQVKRAISSTVERVTKGSPREELKPLFFEKMAKLSHRIFDRASISKEFTYFLNPELLKLKSDPARKLERRVEKAKLAVKLGVQFKANKSGNSGSYFARDYKGKIIGVYKPGQEVSLGSNSPKLMAKIIYVMKRILFGEPSQTFWPYEGYLAEVMTHALAKHCELDIVPASKVVEFERGKGSFQLFVKNSKTANGLKKIDQDQYEAMALVDFATCSRDRHFGNLLKSKKGIHLIDNELSFPKQHPLKKDFLYQRNQYKWTSLAQSKTPFSEDFKNKAHYLLKGERLKALIHKLHEVNDPHGTGFASFGGVSSQEQTFKERVAVVLKVMELGLPIQNLASLKTQESIQEFVRKYQLDVDAYLKLR